VLAEFSGDVSFGIIKRKLGAMDSAENLRGLSRGGMNSRSEDNTG
jgi:hypothetical protein